MWPLTVQPKTVTAQKPNVLKDRQLFVDVEVLNAYAEIDIKSNAPRLMSQQVFRDPRCQCKLKLTKIIGAKG